MDNVTALLKRWKEDAEALEQRYFDPTKAMLVALHIEELRNALNADANETVTLTEAARLTGYAPGTLSRQVKQGKLGIVDDNGTARIRIADLPKKPCKHPLRGTIELHTVTSKAQDARAAVTPFMRGAHGKQA